MIIARVLREGGGLQDAGLTILLSPLKSCRRPSQRPGPTVAHIYPAY